MIATGRCPVCANRDWVAAPERGWRACSHCGLRRRFGVSSAEAAVRVSTALARRRFDGARLKRLGVLVDDYTLRIAATGMRRRVAEIGQRRQFARRHSHGRSGATSLLRTPIACSAASSVTLGLIVRVEELPKAVRLCTRLASHLSKSIILVDSDRSVSELGEPQGDTKIVTRSLNDDFGAQRTALQALSSTRWMLQIDTDECPDDHLLRNLGWLVSICEQDGLRSIGFQRRNFVDGTLSDHFPDIQYRLNRRDVAYSGVVHERPDLDGRWQDSMVSPLGALDHYLSGGRVRARSRQYEAMQRGAGRREDEMALRRPFDPH